MAIIKNVTSSGTNKVNTLNGKIYIDEARNAIVGKSRTGITQFLLIIDSDDGRPHLYMTKPGIDVEDAIDR